MKIPTVRQLFTVFLTFAFGRMTTYCLPFTFWALKSFETQQTPSMRGCLSTIVSLIQQAFHKTFRYDHATNSFVLHKTAICIQDKVFILSWWRSVNILSFQVLLFGLVWKQGQTREAKTYFETCWEPGLFSMVIWASPALRKAVMASITAARRSNAPACAPCHIMANSPDTL